MTKRHGEIIEADKLAKDIRRSIVDSVVAAIERGETEVLVNTDEIRGRFRSSPYPYSELSALGLSTETVYDIDFAVFARRPPLDERLWHVDSRVGVRVNDLATVVGIMLRWGVEKVTRLAYE